MSTTRWAQHIHPYGDELLSSYLVRLAHAHGQSPSQFAIFQFPGCEVWTRDVDRSASRALLSAVAGLTGLEVQALRNLQIPLSKSQQAQHPLPRPGVEVGVTAIGMYHRKRFLHGQMVCPLCVESAPYLRKIWRFTWATECLFHRAVLLDACYSCGAVIAPHRSKRSLIHCAECGVSLMTSRSDRDSSITPPLAIEVALAKGYFTGRVEGSFGNMEFSECLSGLRFIHRALCRKKANFRNCSSLRQLDGRLFAGRPEMMRVESRQQLLAVYDRLLRDLQQDLVPVLLETRVTQADFPSLARLPTWLQTTVQSLPHAKKRTPAARKPQTQQQVARLHRLKRDGWRSSRAELLLKLAGLVR